MRTALIPIAILFTACSPTSPNLDTLPPPPTQSDIPPGVVQVPEITSFEECAEHFPVMESYPRQCRTIDGDHFVEEVDVPVETP